MSDDSTSLAPGAGTTTSTTGTGAGSASGTTSGAGSAAHSDITESVARSTGSTNSSHSGSQSASTGSSHQPSSTGSDTRQMNRSSSQSGSYHSEEHSSGKPSTAVVVGSALAGAIAGGIIPFMLATRSRSGSASRGENATVERSVTINKPARALYDFWRDFTNFPQFMENIRSVNKLDERRSHWVIEAPAGTSVEFDSLITEDVPGRLIAWRSEEGASVPNHGRVEFFEQDGGRSTLVRATISYNPPAGAAGRLVAKLFKREPGVQADRDLHRLKELMETGKVSDQA